MWKCLIQYQSLPRCHREQFSALLCYINDINQNINSKIRLFADDRVLYREINSKLDCLGLQQDLQKLVVRSHTWQMSFSINKCHTLHAHRKKQPIIHTYTMDNTPVTPVTHHPYLGIELQMDNTHTEHNQQSREDTKHAEKKPQTSLHNCKITGIQKMVRPQLEYASAITLHKYLFFTKTTELAFSFGPTSTK